MEYIKKKKNTKIVSMFLCRTTKNSMKAMKEKKVFELLLKFIRTFKDEWFFGDLITIHLL